MKQKDIAMVVVIVVVSGMLSFFVSRWLIASPESRQVKVEVVESISTDFERPDAKYFNEQSINPTQVIRIGDGTNNTPFSGL